MNWILILDHVVVLPELVLMIGACVVLLLFADGRRNAGWIAHAVLLLCAISTLFVIWATEGRAYYRFNGLYVSDFMGHVLKLACYAAASATLVYSRAYLFSRGLLRGEFVALLLFALLGMMVMISASSFLTLYLGLELMSLCLYALVALDRDSPLATEAAMKYFVLGALSSGLLLYGMSMIYGGDGAPPPPRLAAGTAPPPPRGAGPGVLRFGTAVLVGGAGSH